MKKLQSTATAAIAAFCFAGMFAGAAHANCLARVYGSRTSPSPVAALAPKQPVAAAQAATIFPAPEPSIAGYWYVQFRASGQLIDDGFDVWQADGSEILNDTPAPASGNICVGIWQRTDTLTYTLKHPSWVFDDAGVNLTGIAIIRETVKLDSGGNSFTGTATLDLYDLSGNLMDEETSQVSAARINAVDDATAPATPIPGLPAMILKR